MRDGKLEGSKDWNSRLGSDLFECGSKDWSGFLRLPHYRIQSEITEEENNQSEYGHSLHDS
jgi:hypothetical protein